ncbi:MAG TPA: sigma-70 family RNA polymerase sigma factor [Candidatus Solibacter sp.]|jgi:RNA polymerase sigma-70 factor (ECF subfamily)|nr:sigma-70 family RNA polymerase sigma factor [Candidatus Solibacter sp.]
MELAVLAMAGAAETPEEQRSVIEAAKSGDLAAFEILMRQHERLVLVTALRLVGNMPDAQDVSQEVFLKLYRNLRKVDGAQSIAGWLYRVTVNAVRDLQRRKRPEAPMEFAENLPAGGTDPQQAATEAERRRALEMSLRMLPEKERAALVLRDLEGLTTEEVARVLGSSEATVRSQISKARVKVRGFVERYFRSR